MTEKFAHLHLHSRFSLFDGMGDVEAYVKRAVELGQPALAITDHGNLFGAVKFYNTCKKHGIKPLLGEEFYIVAGDHKVKESREMYHLTVLAKDDVGWKNLCKLSSLAYTEGFYYKPRIDKMLLSLHKKGLIVLSGCIGGIVAKFALEKSWEEFLELLDFFQMTFGKDFYLETMPHDIPEQKKLNDLYYDKFRFFPSVLTNDPHYVLPEDEQYHNFLLKMQTYGKDDKKAFSFNVHELYLKDRTQMWKAMKGYDVKWVERLLDTTMEVVSKVSDYKFDTSHKLPIYQEA